MKNNLNGKIVFVTGATSGIGRKTAELFCEKKATVIITGRRKDLGLEIVKEMEKCGAQIEYMPCDMNDTKKVIKLMEAIKNKYGKIDIAFNNAAAEGPIKRIEDMEEEDIDYVINVNLKSILLCMKYELEIMKSNNSGIIINTASFLGMGFGFPGSSIYAASKSAIISVTKTAALESAGYNIRVNSISPGWIETDMTDKISETLRSAKKEIALEKFFESIPLKRKGNVADVAKVVLFLCSEDASYINAANIVIDGGISSMGSLAVIGSIF